MDEAAKPPPGEEEKPPHPRPPGEPLASPDGQAPTVTATPGSPAPRGGSVASPAPSFTLPRIQRERYRPQGLVAMGGQGRVLRAEDPCLGRMVALKELLEHGGVHEERFLHEARITARLQHPSIIPIYEAGRWPEGEPFYAMKLVSDRSLAQLIESMRSLEERLGALPHVLAVAEAMAYAHSQRVIHRDLKPSNILVGEFGETVVIDWGLAKELGRPGAAPAPGAPEAPAVPHGPEPARTQLGAVMGTPSYMPPEQAAGQPVDERADVYSLGALLYHLLSGQAPYTGSTAQEVLQRVLSTEPPALARLQPGLPEDLLTLVSRAMAREPARRYPSARELADDLRRFQTGQLVGAHHYTPWKLLWRFARRHWMTFSVAAAALMLLVAMGMLNHQNIINERQVALQERDRAEQQKTLAEQARREALRHADQLTLERAREVVAQAPAQALTHLDSVSDSFEEWGQVRTLAADALAQGLPRLFQGHEASVSFVDCSPDGRWLVSASDDHTVRLWDTRSGTHRILETVGDEAWRSLFSPDGRFVASAGKDGQVRLYELSTGTSRPLKGHTASVSPMRFTPDSRLLYSIDVGGQLWRWDVPSGAGHLLGAHGPSGADLVLLPDGRHLLTIGVNDPALRLWNTADGSSRLLARLPHPITSVTAASAEGSFAASTSRGEILLWKTPEARALSWDSGLGAIDALALSADGRYLAAAFATGPIRLWDLARGTTQTFPSTPGWRASAVFSRDGRWLAAGSKDGQVRIWEIASGRLRLLRRTGSHVNSSLFSPEGKWLVTAHHDSTIRLHAVEEPHPRLITRHEEPALAKGAPRETHYLRLSDIQESLGDIVQAIALTPDGQHVISVGKKDSRVRVSTLAGAAVAAVQAHPEGMTAAFIVPGGHRLVTAGSTGMLALWDETGRQLHRLSGPQHLIRKVSASADGAWVAAGDASGAVWLWEVGSGRGRALGSHSGDVLALAFSPDGRTLASACIKGEVRLWDVANGTGRQVHRHESAVGALAFSPDGRLLASGSEDHTVWLRALDSSAEEHLELGDRGVHTVRFSPDGQTLFIVSVGGVSWVKRWDVRGRRFLEPLRGHAGFVTHMAFSPEGLRLATASVDGTVRLWDLHSAESRALRGHEGPVVQVAFAQDGQHVLSAGQDGSVRLWMDDLPLEPAAIRERVHQALSP